MDKVEYLIDTIEYYSVDPKARRCVENFAGCKYSPKTIDKPTSEGCAVGRMLDPDVAYQIDQDCGTISFKRLSDHKSDLIPDWLLEMGVDFVYVIQALHDFDEYWDGNGLSDNGKRKVKRIARSFLNKGEERKLEDHFDWYKDTLPYKTTERS